MHILSHDQNQIANHFSKPSQDKFAGLAIERSLGEVPLLAGCTTRIQCKTAYRYDGGDHIIMVSEVMNFEHSDITPLVYQRGNYAIATGKELADEVEALINASASSNRGDASSLSHLLGTAYFQMYPPKKTRQRRTDVYEVFCAILYLLKSGVSNGNLLPQGFPC